MAQLNVKFEISERRVFGKKTKTYVLDVGDFHAEGSKEEIERAILSALAGCKPQVALVRVRGDLRVHVKSYDGVETFRPRDNSQDDGVILLQHTALSGPDTLMQAVNSSLLAFAQENWKPGDDPPNYLNKSQADAFNCWAQASR